jgi:hypothetical protein
MWLMLFMLLKKLGISRIPALHRESYSVVITSQSNDAVVVHLQIGDNIVGARGALAVLSENRKHNGNHGRV